MGRRAPAQEGDTLVIARDMDINSLDPARAWCDTCQIYLSSVYEPLVGLDTDNRTLVPAARRVLGGQRRPDPVHLPSRIRRRCSPTARRSRPRT